MPPHNQLDREIRVVRRHDVVATPSVGDVTRLALRHRRFGSNARWICGLRRAKAADRTMFVAAYLWVIKQMEALLQKGCLSMREKRKKAPERGCSTS